MRSLEDTLVRARREMRANPSISVYTIVDGRERRRYINPFGRVGTSMAMLAEAVLKTSNRFAEFGESFRKAMPGVEPVQPYTIASMFTLRDGGRR